jgi:hypothetical protein
MTDNYDDLKKKALATYAQRFGHMPGYRQPDAGKTVFEEESHGFVYVVLTDEQGQRLARYGYYRDSGRLVIHDGSAPAAADVIRKALEVERLTGSGSEAIMAMTLGEIQVLVRDRQDRLREQTAAGTLPEFVAEMARKQSDQEEGDVLRVWAMVAHLLQDAQRVEPEAETDRGRPPEGLDELTTLAWRADRGDRRAAAVLTEKARAAGMTNTDIMAAPDWAAVAAMIVAPDGLITPPAGPDPGAAD